MASNINPNNIDGTYPVAGQDNNSQGFRDNFTNIKTNFQFAEDEITDLQNKVVLKAALTGTSLDNNMNDNLIYAARIQDFSATKVTISPVSNVYTFNYASGHYQTFATVNATSPINFVNFPPSGTYGYCKLQVQITNTAHTIQIPATVSLGLSGIQGISPGTAGVVNSISFGATGFYEFGFGSYDAGATITIFDLNRALDNFGSGTLTVANLFASATVSAAGNITGANFNTDGLISATGNVLANNVLLDEELSATGNIIGANFSTAGNVIGTITGKLRPLAPTATTANNEPLRFTAGTGLLSTPVSGAVEYDGDVFYASPVDDKRGVIASSYIRCLASNNTLSDTDSAQNVFASPSAITLSASTTYDFEAMYVITRAAGAVNHTISTLFALSGTLTSVTYVVETTSSAGNVLTAVSRIYSTAATAVVVTAASTATNENVTIRLRGVMRTNAAGTVTPQIRYSAAPGGQPTVVQNSFIRFTAIGDSGVDSIGEWV